MAETSDKPAAARPLTGREWLWCVQVVAAGLAGVLALAAPPDTARAADIQQSTAIACEVTEGRGAIAFGPSKYLGAAAGTHRFSPWVLARDGVNLRDRIGLFWETASNRKKALRVAIDGPVSKPTHLISATDDTLVAVAVTSDQHTTRSWMITINFPQETVAVVASSSGAAAVKSQVMVLSCAFEAQLAGKTAADSWRR